VEQAIFLIKDRAANKCCFYSEYFGVGKKLHSRVKLAREWLDENCSKYSFIQTSSKDGLLSPLPWFVDRVGAMASNVSNAHEL